jgi:hypothetical protein
MLSKNKQTTRIVILLALFVALTGCAATEETSSSGSGSSLPALKVSVSGLQQGKNVVLSSGQSTATNVFTENEALGITTDGTYSFGSFASGISYNITVRQQPVSQTCTVTSGEGTLSASTTVVVTCSSDSYTISGTVVGMLSGQSVTLQNNSGDDLTVSDNMSFSFSTSVASGEAYLVTVKTQPTGQTCTPNLNSGVVSDNVSDVSIICSYTVYTVSGSVSGLSGTLVLQNNYGSDQTLTSDGSFSFEVASSAKYNVRAKTQPNGKCVVSNGTGTTSADVDNVSVGCWVLVDGGGSSAGVNKNSTYRADNVSLHSFDNNSNLYASWSEVSQYGSISQIRVKEYDNSSWSAIDGDSNNGINLIKSRNATNPSMTDNGTHLFAVWSEDDGSGKGLIRTAVYDNTTRSWDFQNNNFQALNYSTSRSANNPQLLNDNSSLYAIWSENNGTANQIRVKLFDNSTSWNLVDKIGDNTTGINKDTSKNALNPKLLNFNSEIYAAWSETDSTASQIRVARYNNSSSWTFVDGNASTGINKTTSKNATDPSMAVLSTKLYLAWSETNADNRTQIRVKSYDGSNWSFVDGNNATKGINKDYTQNASYPQLVKVTDNSSSSKLYAVWLEENGSTQVHVAEFDGNSSWSFKDGNSFDGLNLNTAKITGKPSAVAHLYNLIVAWSETNSLGVPQIRVVKSPF